MFDDSDEIHDRHTSWQDLHNEYAAEHFYECRPVIVWVCLHLQSRGGSKKIWLDTNSEFRVSGATDMRMTMLLIVWKACVGRDNEGGRSDMKLTGTPYL